MRKISPEQVEEIKKLFKEGVKLIDIAERFNVSQPTISYWIDDDYREKLKLDSSNRFKSLSPEEKKINYSKKKDYMRDYMRNRYKNDEVFRKKIIERNKK
jgi:uncharacterized protein YjcR